MPVQRILGRWLTFHNLYIFFNSEAEVSLSISGFCRVENIVRKNNTTLYSYFPAPLSVEGYFAILDQDPPVLSVLQAPCCSPSFAGVLRPARWWSRCSGYSRSPFWTLIIHVINEYVDKVTLLISAIKNNNPHTGRGDCFVADGGGGIPGASR